MQGCIDIAETGVMGGRDFGGEHRRFTRREANDLEVRVFDGAKELVGASLVDLSTGGLGLFLPDRVQYGRRLRFQVSLPSGFISGTGSVRWSWPQHRGFRSGLQIQELNWLQRLRLRSFIKEIQFTESYLFDGLLLAAAVVIAALAAAKFLGS